MEAKLRPYRVAQPRRKYQIMQSTVRMAAILTQKTKAALIVEGPNTAHHKRMQLCSEIYDARARETVCTSWLLVWVTRGFRGTFGFVEIEASAMFIEAVLLLHPVAIME